jgi:hypothetical protein
LISRQQKKRGLPAPSFFVVLRFLLVPKVPTLSGQNPISMSPSPFVMKMAEVSIGLKQIEDRVIELICPNHNLTMGINFALAED